MKDMGLAWRATAKDTSTAKAARGLAAGGTAEAVVFKEPGFAACRGRGLRRISLRRKSAPAHAGVRARAAGEDGYILLGVLILLFLFTLALSIAAPMVAKDIQRDKEEEAVQRGKQYKRAIRMYYKKFNTYPATIAQLEGTNNIRFLRKRYKDPVTGKDDWRLIHVGEAKVPVLGFFGQPLQGGTSSVTTGLAGNGTGGLGSGTGIGTGGGTGGAACDPSSAGTGGGTDGGCPAAPAGVLPGMGGGAGGAGSTVGQGTAGSGGTPFGSSTGGGSLGGGNGVSGFGQSAASQSSSIGSGGSTGPIVGVGIALNKKSLVIYHKQDAYNKWEFTYDPIEEQMLAGSGGIPGAQPAGSATGGLNPASSSPTGGNGGGVFGSQNAGGLGGAGISGSGGDAGSGSGSPAPAPPANNPY